MSNVQKALKSVIEALEASPVIDKYGALKIPALRQCKAALAEVEASSTRENSNVLLEKCEPELYMAKNLHSKSYATSHSEAEARLFLLQSGLKVDGIESEVIPLCRCDTSPQPRDWVGLDTHQIAEIRQSMLTDGCLDTVEFADAITAKLKQLNTKG